MSMLGVLKRRTNPKRRDERTSTTKKQALVREMKDGAVKERGRDEGTYLESRDWSFSYCACLDWLFTQKERRSSLRRSRAVLLADERPFLSGVGKCCDVGRKSSSMGRRAF